MKSNKANQPGQQFEENLAKTIAKAVKQRKIQLRGIDQTIFRAGQLSATRTK